jgi:release factor glutamine methyltransferase
MADKLDLLDSELLLAHVLGVERSYLRMHANHVLTDLQQSQLIAYTKRRMAGEPLAYIIGKKEFWSMELEVTPDTLIPRPETECLVETVLQFAVVENSKVADLGTGSGAIALALASERPSWHLFATDISESALQVASKNAQRFRLENISFYLGNWFTALPCTGFNIIAANPPYISEQEWPEYEAGLRFEPRHALLAKDNGMSAIRKIIEEAGAYLLPAGYLVIEHGFLQGEAVRNVLALNGYINIQSVADLSGNQRLSYGQRGN